MPTRIDSEIDFALDGKHHGYLRIPHSVHRSAYGWLPMPAASIRHGQGPVVLLMAGNHGDEYEGQVLLSKIIRTLQPEDITGQLIILPMANFPAALAGRRTSPIDDGNLNRTFPGDANGSPTQMIAHYIEEVLMQRCAVMIDLHSGGSSLLYIPAVQVQLEADGTLSTHIRELAKAFAAPHTQVYVQGLEDRMSEGAARRKGLAYFTTELAGGGMVTPSALEIAERGLSRVLYKVGNLRNAPSDADNPPKTRFVEVAGDEHYCYCQEDGVFEPLVELGDTVVPNQPAARIHFPETPWREPAVAHFKGDGIVVCTRVPGRAQRGDCLFHLGRDWSG